jgi:hypothetical protein
MRAPALALSFLFLATLLAPLSAAEDFGAISKVKQLINIQETPELAPGESGRVVFLFNQTYAGAIQNVRLNASIYRYATIDESMPVDASWSYSFPRIAETGSREWVWTSPSIAPGISTPLNFTVQTAADSHDMPHGTIFSQSSYFVRFWLQFDGMVNTTLTRFVMASPGFFSAADWKRATSANYTNPCNPPSCRGNVNLTLLGVDGILPDSAFGVKEPIPRWPFYGLIALVVFFLLLAFLFWVEENPGTFPRVETWWARTRGRLARTIAPLRPHKRSKT